MEVVEQAKKALARYDLSAQPGMEGKLEATHAAFRVRAGNRLYALRQFNPYTHVGYLRTQFLLAEQIATAGVSTPVPVRAENGEPFVVVERRLWALFPWCEGRAGTADRVEDLLALTSMQGRWIECAERLRSGPRWDNIVCSAQKFRRRKSWAWVVALDQVPRFARQQTVIERAQAEAPDGPQRKTVCDLLSEVDAAVAAFDALLEEQQTRELPRTVTHGDFWVTNISISDERVVVLDLDCYSYEPRVDDFARAANWYYTQRSPSENAHLFKQFQGRARLTTEEAEALPLMMCAHDLYYAVSHVLLWLEEDDPEAQRRLIESIRSEAQAVERYRHERDEILQTFLGGA